MNARTTALSALIACRKQGAWADGVLKEYIARDRLDRRDAALASRLCYGVLQNKMLLDHYITCCLNGPLTKLQPIVLDILRIGMYQIMMMDKVPVSAAVNEAVNQAKKYANKSASGLVNGVLRHASREKQGLPMPNSLSERYSHPQELVDLLRDSVGEESLEALLESHNQAPRTIIQVNPLTANSDAVCRDLEERGIVVEPHPWLKDGFYISNTGNLEQLPSFVDGAFYVQDPAAKLAVLAADLIPGMTVLDGCAAPGGKSFAAAMEMNNQGRVISCDIHPHKIELLTKGAARLGIKILDAHLQDGKENVEAWNGAMDAVIADVPCSGLGVIRKKPDIRYNDMTALSRLPSVQADILNNLSRYVKPGGVLLYSTCTILKRENQAVADQFLSAHPDFHLESFSLPEQLGGCCSGMITLLPSIHDTDGFFICKMRRDQ